MMPPVKFFANWQPLHDEDAHTALVFGFMRHAPVERALAPWLSATLGRDVKVEPLEPGNFWPQYDSVVEGSHWTEPELVVVADDGQPLLVVVEVKPGLGMHTFEQVSREVVDAATGEKVARVALVMIGADLGAPPEVAAWREQLNEVLAAHAMTTEGELHYSSFASLGRTIERCGQESPEWHRYAQDVVAQLRVQGLLGYDGAPVFDDLEELTVVNAVEVFNRAIRAARQLLLTLHSRPAFQAAGYVPFGRNFALRRDGTSTALTESEDYFTTNIALSVYRKEPWPEGAGVYIAVDLSSDDEPELQAGAFFAESSSDLVWSYAYSDEPDDGPSHPRLAATDKAVLPYAAVGARTEWVYDTRPWRPGDGDADVLWALEKLGVASAAWDGQGVQPPPAAPSA
jgi:hypothetical protein